MSSEIDLSNLSARELEELMEKAAAAKKTRAAQELQAKLARLDALVAELGLARDVVAAHFGGRKGRAGGRGSLPPKYRNPTNHSEQWSGRGRKPAWVQELLASGKRLEDLEI